MDKDIILNYKNYGARNILRPTKKLYKPLEKEKKKRKKIKNKKKKKRKKER